MISESKISIFEDYVKRLMEHYEAAGVAVSAIDKAGNVIYEKCFGLRDEKKGLNVDGDTIFGLASITKSFTCLSVMQMEERGGINSDELVKEYLPAFATDRPVKVSNCMSHSGGYFPQKRILMKELASELGFSEEKDGDLAYIKAIAAECGKRTAKRLAEQKEFTGEVGEYLSYSNDGFALLSEIIRLYGGEESYPAYLNENVFGPLGMERSGCDFSYFKGDSNVSKLYFKDNGKRVESDDFYDNAFALMGGGGVKSTLNDMKKYLMMYLNKGKNIKGEAVVGEKTLMKMLRPRVAFGHQEYYGYGLSISNLDNLTLYSHGGSLPGVSSQFAFSYNNEIGVVVLCNTSDVPSAEVSKALMRLAEGCDIILPEKKYREKTISPQRLENLCGVYTGGEGQNVEFIKTQDGFEVVIAGSAFKAIAVQKDIVVLPDIFTDKVIKLFENDKGEIWAIYFGSRMLKRA